MTPEPQPQQSPAAMPAPAVALIVRHPEGSIRVSTPTDVPLGELLPDLVELAGLPDHDAWALGPVGGDPYPHQPTLAELGVGDGALLALRELPGHGSADRDSAVTPGMIRPRLSPHKPAGERPLSDRNARILPVRLSTPARCLAVLAALASRDHAEQRWDRESGMLGPAESTRPARLSPLAGRARRGRTATIVSDLSRRSRLRAGCGA
jgi:WXG100 protein secretion system (Wss), protein YukD